MNINLLNKGSFVYDKNSNLIEILNINKYTDEVAKIYFRDKSFVECSLSHNWLVKTGTNVKKAQPNFIYKTFSLETILKKGLNTNFRPKKFSVPLTSPVIYENKPLTIPPYFLGLLLGDGSLHGTAVSLTVSNSQPEIIDYIKNTLPSSMELLIYNKQGCKALFFVQKDKKSNKPNWLKTELRNLGLLVSGKNKFIPNVYKYNSIENRQELIKGLMDSDGAVSQGSTIFHNKTKKLVDDFSEILRSLGCKALPRLSDRGSKGIEYLVNIQTNFNPFKLTSKKNNWKIPVDKPFNSLFDFEIIQNKKEVISLITNGSTILVNDFIVTYGE